MSVPKGWVELTEERLKPETLKRQFLQGDSLGSGGEGGRVVDTGASHDGT